MYSLISSSPSVSTSANPQAEAVTPPPGLSPIKDIEKNIGKYKASAKEIQETRAHLLLLSLLQYGASSEVVSAAVVPSP